MVVTVIVVPVAELLFFLTHLSPQIVAQFVFKLYVCIKIERLISTVVSPVVRLVHNGVSIIESSAEIDTNAGVIVSSSRFIGVVAVRCTTQTSDRTEMCCKKITKCYTLEATDTCHIERKPVSIPELGLF
jgi:hypothetical protein